MLNPFTGAIAATLRGHNNKIKSIAWTCYDSKIVTMGSEGMVYRWDIFPVARLPEHYPGTQPFAAGCANKDSSRIYIATHDRQIKELPFVSGQISAEIMANGASSSAAPAVAVAASSHLLHGGVDGANVVKVAKSVELEYHVGPMMVDDTRRMLLIASSDDNQPGAILCGLVSPHIPSAFDVSILHSVGITAMCQSIDGAYVYTGDSSGCLIVSEHENASFSVDHSQSSKLREGPAAFQFVEEVLIHKADLESRKDQIRNLSLRVSELTENNEHQLRLKDLDHGDKMKEIETKFTNQLKAERRKYSELDDEKRKVEREFQHRMQLTGERNQKELKEIEMKYKQKQASEALRHKTLMEETEDAHKRWNAENQALVESHQKYLHEITIEYEDKLSAEQRMQKKISSEKEVLQVEFSSNKNETEEFGDAEVAEMKIRYDSKLKKEEEEGLDLMAQHAVLKKSLQNLGKDSGLQKDEIKRLRDKETRLYETIHSLEKDIQSHKKEIREREETITDKEKRIFDLKKKNQVIILCSISADLDGFFDFKLYEYVLTSCHIMFRTGT